ncbi:MAG: ROK family protein, partial [Alphaproteobacteria bacterium]|nr:ROK family protein [Alphaproteobacteria bacterium]
MRLGIDLGGTKTEAAVIDDDGVIVWRKRVPSARHSYAETISTISGIIETCATETGFNGPVGMGIPGSVS